VQALIAQACPDKLIKEQHDLQALSLIGKSA